MAMMKIGADIATPLLSWYDENARELPWRVGPAARKAGVKPDPYRVWLSEIMLQQTTVATVAQRFDAFVRKWPTVDALAAADVEDVLGEWAGLGYYARARNLHACARQVVDRHSGRFPDTEEELLRLPGIGPYTAGAIAAIAFDRLASAPDGNVERVMARVHAVDAPLPAAKATLRDLAASHVPTMRAGDYAQALMDLGATVCAPKKPDCRICPLFKKCVARERGIAEGLPRKLKKAPKPERAGAAFVLFDPEGRVFPERRPDQIMLGGLMGFPGTPWWDKEQWAVAMRSPESYAPTQTRWRKGRPVVHTFTHFRLTLDIWVGMGPIAEKGIFPEELESVLPTLMAKAMRSAVAELRRHAFDYSICVS